MVSLQNVCRLYKCSIPYFAKRVNEKAEVFASLVLVLLKIRLIFLCWIWYNKSECLYYGGKVLSTPLKGFITYSHEDTAQKDELRKRLAIMEQQNELVTWDDGQLTPGDGALQEDILKKVADSDLLLYLVSAASLASKNCNKELAEALKQEIRVIPIILEHCDWLRHHLSGFEVFPSKGKPISKWEDESEGWQNVVDGIWETVDAMRVQADLSSESAQNNQLGEWVFQQGNFLFMLKQINMAIEAYSYAIDLNPNNAAAYNNQGIAHDDKGEVDKAIKDYNKAIKLNPNYVYAYNNRGIAYRRKGEIERAIEDYNTAIELKSNYAEAHYNRGNVYNDNGETELAIKDYNKAIKLDPNDADIYCNRGNAYFKKGEINLTIKDYNKAIKLNPNYVYAYNNRGIVYQNNGEVNKAIEDYTTAIRLESKHGMPYYNRGEVWLRLKEWDKAKTDILTARKNGLDIIARFRSGYKNVEAFEQRHSVKLPEDIALLLTQRRRTRYPKTQKILDADGNPIESPNVVNLRSQLRNAGIPLGEYIKTKPSFGINTAPTEVFVVDKATRDKLITAHPLSADILKPFLHGKDLRRWHVDTPQQWLIFSCRGIAINDYPAILKHLEKYREPLSKRKGKQEWYELPVSLGDAERFTQPKLVSPNTYNHQTFAVDTSGYYYGNTSYLILTEETWLCGLLNSRTVEWFYSQVSNQLTIDPLRARSGYIQQIPIPDLTSTQKALIAKIVDYLIYLQQQPTTNSKDLKHARDAITLGYFERIIDGLVYEAYLPEDLHKGDKHFFQPLLDEQLPSCEEIQGDKMTLLRDIFELLYERTHLVRRNLYYLDSVKAVRIIEGKI